MSPRKIGCVAVVVGALALGAAACGGDESVESAEQNLCSSLAGLSAALTELSDLEASSTKEDVQGAADAVRDAWEEVQSDAEDLSGADTSALESASDDLQSAVDDLSDDTTFAEALPELSTQLEALRQTRQEMSDGLNCR